MLRRGAEGRRGQLQDQRISPCLHGAVLPLGKELLKPTGKSGPCSSRGCGGVGSFCQPLDAGFGVGFGSCAVTGAPLGFPVLDAPRCPLPLTARGPGVPQRPVPRLGHVQSCRQCRHPYFGKKHIQSVLSESVPPSWGGASQAWRVLVPVHLQPAAHHVLHPKLQMSPRGCPLIRKDQHAQTQEEE